jgi:PIN domain nuclease of toxin-antitoxin system
VILLDTNVVVRIMTGEGLIGRAARDLLDDSDELCCSAMVQWEIATLARKEKLRFEMPVDVWLEQATRLLGYAEVPVTGAIARDAGGLPGPIHGDPGDRIMIATARTMACPLMTTDEKILDYAAAGHLKAIDARR